MKHSSPGYAYVGARTARKRGGRGDGITVFRRDPHSGALEAEGASLRFLQRGRCGGRNPVHLALSLEAGIPCGSPICMVFDEAMPAIPGSRGTGCMAGTGWLPRGPGRT